MLTVDGPRIDSVEANMAVISARERTRSAAPPLAFSSDDLLLPRMVSRSPRALSNAHRMSPLACTTCARSVFGSTSVATFRAARISALTGGVGNSNTGMRIPDSEMPTSTTAVPGRGTKWATSVCTARRTTSAPPRMAHAASRSSSTNKSPSRPLLDHADAVSLG